MDKNIIVASVNVEKHILESTINNELVEFINMKLAQGLAKEIVTNDLMEVSHTDLHYEDSTRFEARAVVIKLEEYNRLKEIEKEVKIK